MIKKEKLNTIASIILGAGITGEINFKSRRQDNSELFEVIFPTRNFRTVNFEQIVTDLEQRKFTVVDVKESGTTSYLIIAKQKQEIKRGVVSR